MTLELYLRDSLNIITQSLRLIEDDYPFFYRVIALQLRLILCDTTRIHDESLDTSLIRQINPLVKLHALGSDPDYKDPSRMLSLDDWLAAELPGSGLTSMTIRKLIRQVCDTDGGAHVDRRGSQLLPPNHCQWIIRIAESVIASLKQYRD